MKRKDIPHSKDEYKETQKEIDLRKYNYDQADYENGY